MVALPNQTDKELRMGKERTCETRGVGDLQMKIFYISIFRQCSESFLFLLRQMELLEAQVSSQNRIINETANKVRTDINVITLFCVQVAPTQTCC